MVKVDSGLMIETDLSIEDFTRFFERGKLGRLILPNGRLEIDLDDLYRLMVGWRINHTLVQPGDIVAIIVFGSAVRYPGVKKIPKKHRKFLLFGPEITTIEEIPIQPEDADFLVITSQNLTREVVLKPEWEGDDYIQWIEKGGIHLVNRGVSQLLNGIKAGDTVSISTLREGVPIFFNRRFCDILAQSGIDRITPRKLYWSDEQGILNGHID